MTALTADRNTPSRLPGLWAYPLEAGAVIYAGAICALNAAGNLVPGGTSAALKAVGRANRDYNNAGGAAGAIMGWVEPGIFGLNNSPAGADLITPAMRGNTVYMVDDNVVAATSATNTRSVMGVLIDLDINGVPWVHVGLVPTVY